MHLKIYMFINKIDQKPTIMNRHDAFFCFTLLYFDRKWYVSMNFVLVINEIIFLMDNK